MSPESKKELIDAIKQSKRVHQGGFENEHYLNEEEKLDLIKQIEAM